MKENFEEYLNELNIEKDSTNVLKYLQEINSSYGHVSFQMINLLAQYLNLEPGHIQGVASFYHFINLSETPSQYRIRVCRTLSCEREPNKKELINYIKENLSLDFGEKNETYSLDTTSCLGLCDMGPAIMVNEQVYTKVTKEKFDSILEGLGKEVDKSRVYERNSLVNTEIISLKKILNKDANDLLDIVIDSNIRGRGGAGYPIGLKLKALLSEEKKDRYIVCNGDEGEPSTFKDRYLLEEKVELLISGIVIAMHMVEAKKAFIYIRGEYKYLEDKINKAIIEMANRLKQLDIYRTFDIQLTFGSGAYICGEETALIESLEGKRGEARNRPPYPADVGYLHSATAVNNIETLCTLAKTIDERLKDKESRQTKLFSISGDLENKGIYEISLDKNVEDIVKLAKIDKESTLVYGGASGIFLYPSDFNLKITDKKLPFSSAIYVVKKDEDLWSIIENILNFFHDESCSQCTPCRDGLDVLTSLVNRYRAGEEELLEKIDNLAATIKATSKCGLGQSSCNLLLSYLQGGILDEYK